MSAERWSSSRSAPSVGKQATPIEEGARSDRASAPRLTRLEVVPARRVVEGAWQQLQVRACFAGGTTRDATREAVFAYYRLALAAVTIVWLMAR